MAYSSSQQFGRVVTMCFLFLSFGLNGIVELQVIKQITYQRETSTTNRNNVPSDLQKRFTVRSKLECAVESSRSNSCESFGFEGSECVFNDAGLDKMNLKQITKTVVREVMKLMLECPVGVIEARQAHFSGKKDCPKNLLPMIRSRCSDRKNCYLLTDNAKYHSSLTCPVENSLRLTISYTCNRTKQSCLNAIRQERRTINNSGTSWQNPLGLRPDGCAYIRMTFVRMAPVSSVVFYLLAISDPSLQTFIIWTHQGKRQGDFNTKIRGYGKLITIRKFPFEQGKEFVVRMHYNPTQRVFVDGVLVYDFPKRYDNLKDIGTLRIRTTGELIIEEVGF